MTKIIVVFATPEANSEARERRKELTDAIDRAIQSITVNFGQRVFDQKDYTVNITFKGSD